MPLTKAQLLAENAQLRQQLAQFYEQHLQRLREYYQDSPLPTYIWEQRADDVVLVEHNRAADHLTRGQIARLIGQSYRQLYADRPDICADFERCLHQRVTIEREMHYTLVSTGQTRLMKAVYTPLHPHYVIVCIEDLTERKQAEERLRESEERFSKAFYNNPIAMGIRRVEDDTLLDLNPAFERLFGYSRQELLGKKVGDLDLYTEPAARQVVLEAAQAGQPLTHMKLALRRRSGEVLHVTMSVEYITLHGVPCALASFDDVTQQTQTEHALRQSEQLLATIFDHTHIMVAYLDPQFNFIKVNRAYAQADGRTPEFYPGKNHFTLFPNAENEAIFRRVVATGETHSAIARPFEYAYNPERGVTHWDWALVPVKDAHGVISGLVFTLQNVTTHIETAEQLERSRAILQATLDATDNALLVVDLERHIVTYNHSYVELWKMPAEVIETRDARITLAYALNQFVEPETYHASVEALYATPQATARMECVLKDSRIIEVVSQPYFTGLKVAGRVWGFCDITLRKRAEVKLEEARAELEHRVLERTAELELVNRRLREREEHFRQVVETAPYAMLMVDAAGKIMLANRQTEIIFGYPNEQLLGQAVEKLLPARSRMGHVALRDKFLAQPQGRFMNTGRELIGQHRLGPEIPLDIALTPLETNAGLAVLVSMFDITERKQAEQAIRESELRYRSLFHNTLDGVLILDDEARCLAANPATCQLLGYSQEEVLAMNVWGFAGSSGSAQASARWQALLQTGKQSGETVAKHKDGRSLAIEYQAVANILPHLHLLVLHDVTERKLAETQLQMLNTELTRSNAELEQFAYIASHDLQEPLRMVTRYNELLAKRYSDKLDDNAKEFIQFAIDGAQRMSLLIKALLEYSRIGRNMAMTTVAMGEVLQLAQRNLTLAVEDCQGQVEADPLPTVRGNTTLLVQLLQNLIGNALKFRRPNQSPHIKITAHPVTQQHWQFSVQDNGIGIPPDQQDKLFVIFRRLHTREAYPGTGIGLAVCKKIVEQHSGCIWVESNEQGGATFFFTLPAADTP